KDTSPDGVVPTHYHIYFKFKSPVHFPYLKEAFPYGDIEKARSGNACVQYLIHKNNPEKTQYSKDEVISNFTQDELEYLFLNNKKLEKLNEESELADILEGIANNEIRRFNMFDYISVELYSKHRAKIENAFKYRDIKLLTNPNRSIDVIFVTGAAGNGKTTFAKSFGNGYNGICVSSSSNDPLQDYCDQDVLILDDLRDEDFKFQDLLKILDPHTASSMKSRYNNKVFVGKLIVITSYKTLRDWYGKVPHDAKKQLYRRMSLYVQVEKEEIDIYTIDADLTKTLIATLPNVVPTLIKEQEKAKKTDEFVSGAINHYFDSMKSLVPEEEIERGLAGVKYGLDGYDKELPF
ncbi:MAG: hypothetical protein IKT56_05935, partial [Clostridia bacterium]|nr:hypothetical protein [Clostridia bacterium]